MTVKYGVWLPLFDELADARVIAELAVAAEDAGWDGFFVWDHLRWREPIQAIADPWITLTAVAVATSRLTIGTLVTPLARRRPAILARQTATLDRLSGGRLVLGVGLGGDRFGAEFSRFGDEVDDRIRAEMTDEALEILRAAWSGEQVDHRGRHYTVDGVRFLPRPERPAGIPVWIAGFPGNVRPRRRAARHDGFFPVNLTHPDQLAEAVAGVRAHRADPTAPYDVLVALDPSTDPEPYIAAGATWCVTDVDPMSMRLADVSEVVRAGPWRR